MTPSGPKTIGRRYTLKRQIGRGGMGAVWLAVDEVLGRRVAVKRVGLFPGGSSPDLLRAQREAKLAASLNHPHVVSVFDFVTEGDEQWLVMEYVPGTNLSDLAGPEGLPPQDAAAILGQVAEALTAAHSAGIVHRDVKPSNILVTDDGTAKLADFGIARARADSTLTGSGMVTGSPAYLAPEVVSGNPATEASDVWSLGATLYHTLTGRPPYDVSDNVLAAMYRIVHDDPPRLPDTGWPADLLETTMVADPEQRWPMSRVREYLPSGPTGAAQTGVEAVPTAVLPVLSPTVSLSTLPSAAANGQEAEADPDDLEADPEAGPPAGPKTEPDDAPLDLGGFSSEDEERGRRWTLPILLGLALLVIVAMVGWAFLQQDPSPTAGDDQASTASRTPSPRAPTSASPRQSSPPAESTPSKETNTPEDGATNDSPRSGPGGGRVGEMSRFVQQYVATALSDPETSWDQLTPRFQQDVGDFDSYAGFWSSIDSATLRDIRADPDTMEVSYTVTWDPEGDRGPEDEFVVLGLVKDEGRYFIDYER